MRLGRTIATATVTATLEPPYADRQSEGSIRFNIAPPPMASLDFARPSDDSIEMGRLIERGLRESRAVDVEALCVQAGRRVWHLNVDIRLVDACGNAVDAVGLAALGALCCFRRPDVTIDPDAPGGVIVHPVTEREPLPLTLHHLPLPVTFAFFEEGDLLVVDPLAQEEATASGRFTVTTNPYGEVCAAQKARGVGVSPSQLMRCIRIATEKVKELTGLMRKALDAHETARVAARVKRHGRGAPVGSPGGVEVGTSGPVNVALDGSSMAALPDEIQRFVARATAEDSSVDGQSTSEEEEEEGADVGEAEGFPMEDEAAPEVGKDGGAAVNGDDAMSGGDGGVERASAPQADQAIVAAAEDRKMKKRGKKSKRRRSGNEDGEDQFATIADIIAGAGGGEGGGGLGSALKRKPGA